MTADRTPLYRRHREAGGHMVDFAGWEMPQHYTSVREEQHAVRTSAGLFDVSHMGRFDVAGAGAGEFLQALVTNDVSRIEPGHAQYTLLCNDAGGIIDDLIVYRDPAGDYSLVVNASNRDKDMAWMRDHAPASVELRDRSQEISLLAFQGPLAAELLPGAGKRIQNLAYFGCDRGKVAGVPALVARTGYTGEDGFEIFVPSEKAAAVWETILEGGRDRGVRPAGLAARDVCRLEAGLRLYGSDMDESTSPYEAGLGWTVKLPKGAFVGSRTLAQMHDRGPGREIVGLRCHDRGIPRHDSGVSRGEEQLGKVTSGTYSFWLGHGIAMAMLGGGRALVGSTVELEGRGGSAAVVRLPFYRGSVKMPDAPAKPNMPASPATQ